MDLGTLIDACLHNPKADLPEWRLWAADFRTGNLNVGAARAAAQEVAQRRPYSKGLYFATLAAESWCEGRYDADLIAHALVFLPLDWGKQWTRTT